MYRRSRSSTFPNLLIDSRIRLCHPERFAIRRIVHVALISHTKKLDEFISPRARTTPDQEFPLVRVAQELSTLIRLFDEVLLEEYCKDHQLLDPADIHQNDSTCSFCGSCLFLSSFFCHECIEGTSRPVFICAGCYIEGRSCLCNVMSPVRVGDFQGALRDRNDAVGSLWKSSHLHRISTEGLTELSER